MRVILLLCLCAVSAVQASSLYQLRVGASWTYEVEVKGSVSYPVVNHIVDKHLVDGVEWYQLVEFGDYFWVANTDEGQVEALMNYLDETPPPEGVGVLLTFKFPAQLGEQWTMAYGEVVTYQGTQDMTVPAGSFTCHLYFIDIQKDGYSEFCIAEGVGVVYNASELNGGPLEVARLIAYE